MIPYNKPYISGKEALHLKELIRSRKISGNGIFTKKCQQFFEHKFNITKCLLTTSCTDALEMCSLLIEINPYDEVIIPSYTFVSTALAFVRQGAKIVFVDSRKDTPCLDENQIESLISPKTKAIIPVDLGGVMCDYDRIFEAVESKKQLFNPSNDLQKSFGRVVVLADAAHSIGATYKGKMSGEIADFTSFSFHAVKNLTTAEGGAVTWKDIDGIDYEEIYKQYMLLSIHGQSKDALAKTKLGAWEYDIVAPYYKCNMTDIMASLGLAQLRRYPGILNRRKEIIEKYDELLSGLDVTSMTHYDENSKSCGHLYLLRLNGKDEAFRNEVIIKMAEKGVGTNVHYKPLPMHTAYINLGFKMADYPNAFDMYKNEITLPLHTLLTDEDIEYVVEGLRDILLDK